MPTSHPLRALAVVVGGWTAARVVVLWPASTVAALPIAEDVLVPLFAPVVAAPFDAKVALFADRKSHAHRERRLFSSAERVSTSSSTKTGSLRTNEPTVGHSQFGPIRSTLVIQKRDGSRAGFAESIAPGLPAANSKNRFSGSAWALMRGDGAPSLATGGQLGGSQIGMRLFYTPGPDIVSITARVSAPLSQPAGREAAIGVALRGRNVGIIAEQRIALDKGGRNPPAVFAYGGVSDVKVGGGVKLDGYVQAGVVGVKNPAAFIDGAVRIERPVLKAEKTSLSIGAGAWGGAQTGAARIDIGPQIVARIAVAETTLRVSAEWRQRVAGDAAPASGPSVTVGFDF